MYVDLRDEMIIWHYGKTMVLWKIMLLYMEKNYGALPKTMELDLRSKKHGSVY